MTDPYKEMREKAKKAIICNADPMGNFHYLMDCGSLKYCPNGRPVVCPKCGKPTQYGEKP